MNKKKLNSISLFDVLVYIFVGLFAVMCIYPFLLVISGSLSTQESILKNGFTIFPETISFSTYKTLFMNADKIIRAYQISIFVTVVGTFSALFINTLIAFTLSRRELKYNRFLNLVVLIPILFSGGMVPWYIVCVNILHLKDTIFALILPSLVSSWNIFLIRNYFRSIPEALYEAGKMDGASDFRSYYMYMRLSAPVLATIGLFTCLSYWNDWWLGLMLINKTELQPLQLLLRNIVANIQFLKTMNPSPELQALMAEVPTDALKMTMVVVTIGPIIFVYPFVQKYFVKGIMVGSVKG